MTRAEKCFMTGDGATVGGCGIPRLGVLKYSWNTEALHGLGQAGCGKPTFHAVRLCIFSRLPK